MPKQLATLLNVQTGARVVVEAGSQEAQRYFGQGFVLEQSPGVPVASASTATGGTRTLAGTMAGTKPSPGRGLPTAQATPGFSGMLSGLQFITRSLYGRKPTVGAALEPFKRAGVPLTAPGAVATAVRGFAGQRAGAIGDVFSNVMGMVKEAEAARQRSQDINLRMITSALSAFPTLFGQMTPEEFQSIQIGNPLPTIYQKIGVAAEQKIQTPEEEMVSSLADRYPDVGILLTDPLQAAQQKVQGSRIYQQQTRLAGGVGVREPGGFPTGFWSAVKTGVSSLKGGEEWGTVWNRLRLQFPSVGDEDLDTALGTEWREPGAYEEFKAAGFKPTESDRQADIWKQIGENPGLDRETIKQWIMSQGFSPEDFGYY